MKTIMCYGDSNTWGMIAGTFNLQFGRVERFPYPVRWPGMLQKLLGNEFYIVECGLNGRTTAFEEISVERPTRNGLATLPGILNMHYPIDLVIFMLGTNDVKIEYRASVIEIIKRMKVLINEVKNSTYGPRFQAPKIMLIAPPPITSVAAESFAESYDDASIKKSQQLAQNYSELAKTMQCVYLDASAIAKVSARDGVHVDAENHGDLAKAIATKIKELQW